MNNNLLTATQVAVLLEISVPTLNFWYRFKKENPDNEYAKMLPDFIRIGERQKRLWKKEDICKLIEFQNALPKGRGGIMGNVTQKYYKKGKSNHGKKKSNPIKRGAGKTARGKSKNGSGG